MESILIDCGVGLIKRGNDNISDLRHASTCLGAIQEFNILFPALERALNKKDGDWPQQLFIKHGSLFLKLLENKADSIRLEVDGLIRILDEFRVPEHARILDVPCGIGRHSMLLAERGYNVLGLDLSPLFRSEGECNGESAESQLPSKVSRRRRERDHKCPAQRGAIRCDPEPLEFARILWQKGGYSSVHCPQKPDDKKWVANRRYSQPGLSDRQSQAATIDVVGDLELHERRRFDPETSWNESNCSFYMKREQDLKLKAKLRIHHRVYSLPELRALLERAR